MGDVDAIEPGVHAPLVSSPQPAAAEAEEAIETMQTDGRSAASLSHQASVDTVTENTEMTTLTLDDDAPPHVTMTIGGDNSSLDELAHTSAGLDTEVVDSAFELGMDGDLPDFGPDIPVVPHPGASTPLLDNHKLMPNSSSLSLPLSTFAYGEKANLSETNSLMMPICRICHMPEEESNDLLISPCRCAGSLAFIHNRCLMRWLEITSRKSRKPPRCELCHYQYHRHKKFKFQHWRLPRVTRQDKILHLIFIVNLLIMIGCAIATVMCFLSDNGQVYQNFPKNKVDLTTEEIITLSCGVLFFVSFFIAMSVQIKAKHTIYQLFVKFIMQNMEWEIDEYDKSKDALYACKSPTIHV